MAEKASSGFVQGPVAAGERGDLRRELGPISLVALGIGAVIGAGIFVLTGSAAATTAGPAIVLSFVVAGVGCALAGLCYAEFASMIPVSGSAYTYAHATLGQFVGWVIGWDLILEYLAAGGAVSVGWSAYFVGLMKDIGWELPKEWSSPAFSIGPNWEFTQTGAYLNVPAVAIIVFLATLLIVGIRESAGFNSIMVLVKVTIVLLVILFGLPLIKSENLTPFIPEPAGDWKYGWPGILAGAGTIFFAYIGFDAVSGAAQEARNPQRDMPIGILGSLAICTVLYILMALTMTGLAKYTNLNVANPVTVAIEAGGPSLKWLLVPVNVAAVVGLGTVILVLLYGQSRIFHAMSRDGLLPPLFSAIHPRFGTPWLGTTITAVFAALLGGFFEIKFLGDLVNIGTLAAFVLVCLGIIILRRTKPSARRPFRTPLVPWVPLGGILVCGAMMYPLDNTTWLRFVGWWFIGLVVYAFYSVRHAKKPQWSIEDEPAKK